MAEESKLSKLAALVQQLSRALGQRLLPLGCALLIGFVGGRSVAERAGALSSMMSPRGFESVYVSDSNFVAFAMILLAFFVYAFIRFLLQLGQRVVTLLAQIQTRPPVWLTVAILGSGVLCLLAAVILQWHAASTSARLQDLSIKVETPLMVSITTIGVLLAGLVLLAIGIWSSIPPRPSLDVNADAGKDERNADMRVIRAEAVAGADRPRD
jgi:hypothetical protein